MSKIEVLSLWIFGGPNKIFRWNIRRKEKQDIEDLEMPATKRIFLEQQSYKRQKSKEEKEYLDALNKEVTGRAHTKISMFLVT